MPVGEDQVQHLELSREIARQVERAVRAGDAAFFPEPKALLTPTRRIMGLDGQAKMSKSMGNTVGLLEASDAIWEKLRPAVTDPKRVRRTDPGHAGGVQHLPPAQGVQPAGDGGARRGTVQDGRVGVHRLQEGRCSRSMERELAPIRERARELRANPGRVGEVLAAGADAVP